MKTIGIVSGAVLFAAAGLGISASAVKQAAAKPVVQKASVARSALTDACSYAGWNCAPMYESSARK